MILLWDSKEQGDEYKVIGRRKGVEFHDRVASRTKTSKHEENTAIDGEQQQGDGD
jgi:hypothetical protein